ncbi:MAG: M1 family aminopeptidase, partial [bacterium]
VELYFYDKHLLDYDIFTDVADTCYEAVESILDVFEQVTGVPYPYKKLALVEVPLQMQVYTTRHGLNNVLQQPGIIMIDEVTLASKRLAKDVEDKTKRARKRGQDDSPKRIKRDVFIETVLDVLLSDRLWRRDGSLTSPILNYVHFQLDIADPILTRALELQLYESCERKIRDLFYPDRWNAALSSYDRMRQNEWKWATRRRYGVEIDSVITALSKIALTEIEPEKDGNLYRVCVDFKAPPILQMLSERVGEKKYIQSLQQLLQDFRYKKVQRQDFLQIVQSVSEEEVNDFFKQWFDQPTFPGYRITQAKAEKYDTGKMKIVYQVTTRVQNGEKGEGFVRLVCKTKNDRIRRNLKLSSYEEKEVRFAVNEEPQAIEVIPYFSRNRGKIMKQIAISNRIWRKTAVDTVFTVSSTSDSLSFIVDDQDEGFFTPVSAEAKYLRPPSKGKSWWENTNPYAFGKYYFGWRVKRAGSGSYPARWVTLVPRDGEYELSFYFRASKSWVGRNLSRKFQISITSADGTFPLNFQPQETVDGWYPLGRFQLSKNKDAVIELADKGNGYLIADAVRWQFVQ